MLPRTTLLQNYVRRAPAVVQWGVGVAVILGWPSAVIGYQNRAHKIPQINKE